MGDARTAIGYHEQDLAIRREIGERRGEGNALGNVGNAHADLGDARQAIGYCQQALLIDREIGYKPGECSDLWNSARAHASLGNRPEAIARAAAALEIYEAIAHPSAAKVCGRSWRSGGQRSPTLQRTGPCEPAGAGEAGRARLFRFARKLPSPIAAR